MPAIRSLVRATDVDVLPVDRTLRRVSDHWLVRDPSNPGFHWGNLLIFDVPPRAGDHARWEAAFDAELGAVAEIRHRTFAWDTLGGELGAAEEEFVARGYRLEQTVGLRAARGGLRSHPRANREVAVRALDPRPGVEEAHWASVRELNVAGAQERRLDPSYRAFVRARQEALRQHFRAGRGAWYVAFDGALLVGSLGIVVSGRRARFQMVDTREGQRGRGIASRLVVSAARHLASRHAVDDWVIAADPEYHALRIYESLGFTPVERVSGVVLPSVASASSRWA